MSSPAAARRRADDQRRYEPDAVIDDLARFRYALRKFLRFSENAARQCGVTPQQHQLLLGVAGHTGRGCATISELAEFLQERHHSVVGLVERAVNNQLVHRTQDKEDRRVVIVSLTPRGESVLSRLARLHHEEAKQMQVLLRSRRFLISLGGKKRTGRAAHTPANRKF